MKDRYVIWVAAGALLIGVALGIFGADKFRAECPECADVAGWEKRYARSVEVQDSLRAYIASELQGIDTVKGTFVTDTIVKLIHAKVEISSAGVDINDERRDVLIADPK